MALWHGPLRTAGTLSLAAILGCLGVRSSAGIAAPTQVPFSFIDHRIALEVRVNGRGPYAMVLDTGASATLAADDARALHVTGRHSFEMGGTGAGLVRATVARIGSLDLGSGIVLRNVPTVIAPLDDLRRASGLARFDGLIGRELFTRYVVGIDYPQRTLTLWPPDEYMPDPEGTTRPLLPGRGTPVIDATVDGLSGVFTIDTGDRLPLTLMEPFITEHHLLETYSPKIQALTGWGFGGPIPGYLTRVGHLDIGDIDVEEPLTRLPTVSGGFFTTKRLAGSIGTGVCERFTVTFDFPHRRVTFAHRHDVEDDYDRSGLWLTQRAGTLDVVDVVKGSPADRAEVAKGDRIIAVGSEPVALPSLAALRAALSAPAGTEVTLRVQHGGIVRDVTFVLADLV